MKSYDTVVEDLISHPSVLEMKSYTHHGKTTCYDHAVEVSKLTYKLSVKLNMDYKSATRGALLHDLFLYDWKNEKRSEGMHGFIHGKIAYDNAIKIVDLNPKEKDIILKHMWPLTLSTPRYKESFLVSFVDKYLATKEIIKRF